MKVCEMCGNGHGGKDFCQDCEMLAEEQGRKAEAKKAKARAARRARDEAYRSCGMVKVRGAMGGTYWE
jgi:hypothetical protein